MTYSDIIKAIRSKHTDKPKDAKGQALYWWLRGYAQCQADDVKVIEDIAKGEEGHEGV